MARIAPVVAPDIPYQIIQGGTGGTAGEMSIVSPELMASPELPPHACLVPPEGWVAPPAPVPAPSSVPRSPGRWS